ncbi:DMP19 family protein [Halalkalibacter akibai]|uniref:DNA mimic protein DMP19 C-terminal domain-containing protein n=1 Tax=Halalkalibacter akibai (strain ATCC 43226 / DSM 21942 / CIP 109018 / JCM 9157 / 1139) TaxID=1236973 RepID=W4QX32_HALA3|nr:hypothetical protein [Halalkalibacter akibai]GAE36695.1 hypothetical protein JCM9157_3906 [Halalkalibacter akibai JCM 9157]
MKYKMRIEDLGTKEDIWNAVISAMCEYTFPTENEIANDTYMVYSYYSELESGGHEGLLNGFSWYIEEVGIVHYLQELTSNLKRIGAIDYSKIVKEYVGELWGLFQALENGEVDEEEFYEVVKKADSKYENLNGKLGELLENYFVIIYRDLIDIEG